VSIASYGSLDFLKTSKHDEVARKGVKFVFMSSWYEGLTKLPDSMVTLSAPQTKKKGGLDVGIGLLF
jgi:hypothetical protein